MGSLQMACFCSFHSKHLPHQVFSAQTFEVARTKQGVLIALKKMRPTRLACALWFILRQRRNLESNENLNDVIDCCLVEIFVGSKF